MDFLRDIEFIRKASKGVVCVRGKECLIIDDFYVNLWMDGDKYLNGLQFIKKDSFYWIWSTPNEFINTHLNNKVEFIEHSIRLYGESKLIKPSELKGITKSFSVDYIPKKARCQIFIKGNDVWIKHPDYFSPSLKIEPEDSGAPLSVLIEKYTDMSSRKSKFTYEDSWGDIVLRNEAWLCIKNLVSQRKVSHPIDVIKDIITQQENNSRFNFEEGSLFSSDMSRFFEKVVYEIFKEETAVM